MKFCTQCGDPNRDEAQFCTKCGGKFKIPASSNISAPAANSLAAPGAGNRRKWVGWVLLVLWVSLSFGFPLFVIYREHGHLLLTPPAGLEGTTMVASEGGQWRIDPTHGRGAVWPFVLLYTLPLVLAPLLLFFLRNFSPKIDWLCHRLTLKVKARRAARSLERQAGKLDDFQVDSVTGAETKFPAGPQASLTKHCAGCGAPNQDESQFCTSCGTTFANPPLPRVNPQTSGTGINRSAAEVIRFKCPECKQAIEVPRAMAGDKIQCPTCGHLVGIPTPFESDAQESRFHPASVPSSSPPHRRRLPIIPVIVTLGVLLLIAGGVVLFFYYSPKKTMPGKSLNEMRALAEQGDADAQETYSRFCFDAKDYVESVKWLQKAAEQGNASAQNNLGVFCAKGVGVPQNQTQAADWYRKAAEQGFVESQQNLGLCYYRGEGVPQNYPEAVKWFRKAADQGYAKGQYGLGTCYANGQGISRDDVEAVKWYRKAAEQGNADSQNNLAACYALGKGVAKDPVSAYGWFLLAANQGDKNAADNLLNLQALLSHPQILEAKKWAAAWKPVVAQSDPFRWKSVASHAEPESIVPSALPPAPMEEPVSNNDQPAPLSNWESQWKSATGFNVNVTDLKLYKGMIYNSQWSVAECMAQEGGKCSVSGLASRLFVPGKGSVDFPAGGFVKFSYNGTDSANPLTMTLCNANGTPHTIICKKGKFVAYGKGQFMFVDDSNWYGFYITQKPVANGAAVTWNHSGYATGSDNNPQTPARTVNSTARRTAPAEEVDQNHEPLPPFNFTLRGANLVRIRNPNEFSVTAGIRTGNKGKNFDVPANGVNTVRIPNGEYDIYFVYSDKPDALFQGDHFTLNNNGVEIQIVKAVNGNYRIRQVK